MTLDEQEPPAIVSEGALTLSCCDSASQSEPLQARRLIRLLPLEEKLVLKVRLEPEDGLPSSADQT